ncbi:cobalamin biosynthesis protein CobD [Rhodobacteraceae bacterium 2376]|uniref:Cobalamin biosynthesis protein CobD n=1 Tax=Rhabdonatronobacter sediminivivens TaxID=2743469 RepID=A0A7Z0KZB5_9RHOB|nr:adenosylcobinamide-phosphate synthase CbiB [Rhabdonatronobacter sediminivivens]NYS25371.1 cobalamin biosynthesis protein CobD [Rhabdonatronobacter sediminivivens]
MSFALMMALALAIDAALGWPARVYARIGHPVTWLGALIARAEARLNHGTPRARLLAGLGTTLAVVLAAALPAWALQAALPQGLAGVLIGAVIAWPLLASRSLHDHVAAVATPLQAGDLEGARAAVAMIVGRDPARLDGAAVARAALESLSENASDGVVAPLFWGLVAGLPGIAAYKAINTLDSMIGHRSPRHEYFGKCAARLDDLANWIPARLTGLALALTAPQPGTALRVMARDARNHRSPNAGWPEGAMAGGLGLRLSGPRIYADRVAEEPWLNAAAPDPAPADLSRGLALYRRAMTLICAATLGAWLVGG